MAYGVVILGSGEFTLKMIDVLAACESFDVIGVVPDPTAGDFNASLKR